jgi:hypothetical protein
VIDLLPLVTEYRAGLEAEIAMLRQLSALATRQSEAVAGQSSDTLDGLTDARDRVMASLVAVESQLKPIRQALSEQQTRLRHRAEFQDCVALHREAAALAESILAVDEASLHALREAEMARRVAAESLERGGSTLAAYRRVVMPELSGATLINRKG